MRGYKVEELSLESFPRQLLQQVQLLDPPAFCNSAIAEFFAEFTVFIIAALFANCCIFTALLANSTTVILSMPQDRVFTIDFLENKCH